MSFGMPNTRVCCATGTLADGRRGQCQIAVQLEYLQRDVVTHARMSAETRVLVQYYRETGQVPERIYWLREDGHELIEAEPIHPVYVYGHLSDDQRAGEFPEMALRDTRDRTRKWSAAQIEEAWPAAEKDPLGKLAGLIDELARRTTSEHGR